jgi:hypothetical protein
MALYTTLHFYNAPEGSAAAYAAWFDGAHQTALTRLRGFRSADRFEITEAQMPGNFQPWKFLSVYDFDSLDAAIDLPALAPLLAEARDLGLIAEDGAERLHTYRLSGDWKASPNWRRDLPLSGVSVIIGNYVPGRYQDYQTWYENVHSVEVINVPGHVAMKRGELAPIQLEPRHFCPGDQLVMTAQQTDDLDFTITEFVDRALGRSASGIAMQPRSTAGSLARTMHYFRKISGAAFWPGGIAYGGDNAPYPGKSMIAPAE